MDFYQMTYDCEKKKGLPGIIREDNNYEFRCVFQKFKYTCCIVSILILFVLILFILFKSVIK